MKNKISILLLLTVFLMIILGCENPNKNSSVLTSTPIKTESNKTEVKESATIVDIPQLANKSPEEFAKLVGNAVSITKITNTPEEMPGEFRHYSAAGIEDVLQVRFYKGKAVAFVLTLPKEKQTKTAEELAAIAGFDVKNAVRSSKFFTEWQGNFNGANFEEVKAMKTNLDDYYNLLAKVK